MRKGEKKKCVMINHSPLGTGKKKKKNLKPTRLNIAPADKQVLTPLYKQPLQSLWETDCNSGYLIWKRNN